MDQKMFSYKNIRGQTFIQEDIKHFMAKGDLKTTIMVETSNAKILSN